MLGVMVPLRGPPPQSSEAGPDGAFFPYVHDILGVASGDVFLLDPSGPTLEEQTSQGQR
jgi:hypothetical protein